MLFDAVVKIKIPGNNRDDAVKRLKEKIPHWEFDVDSINACDKQPPSVVGEGKIIMPVIGAKGY
jgi:hypothetical protein